MSRHVTPGSRTGSGALLAVLLVLVACSKRADHEALCQLESRCTGQDPALCVDYRKRRAARAPQCASQQQALVDCMLRDQGSACEREGGARLVATVLCRSAEDDLERCQHPEETMTGEPVGFPEALRAFCDAPRHAQATRPADRATEMARYLQLRASNAQLTALLNRANAADPSERSRLLRNAVKEAGITTCPMLDEAPR
jgi:hypothetical protein